MPVYIARQDRHEAVHTEGYCNHTLDSRLHREKVYCVQYRLVRCSEGLIPYCTQYTCQDVVYCPGYDCNTHWDERIACAINITVYRIPGTQVARITWESVRAGPVELPQPYLINENELNCDPHIS